jgi:hypothetical protein
MMDLATDGEEADQQQSYEAFSWNSRRLWSLWDMLRKHAFQFFVLSLSLERLHRRLDIPLPSDLTPAGFGSLGLLGSPPQTGSAFGNALQTLSVGAITPPPSSVRYLTDEERADCEMYLDFVYGSLQGVEIISLSPEIKRVKDDLSFSPREKVRWQIENITNRILDELKGQSFLHVRATKVEFYDQAELFGAIVGTKFGKINGEITNAGTCFALEQYTACVFHLMRVMEHCVQRFGTKLKVSIDVKNESWANIMDHVNRAIERMPGGPKATPPIKPTAAQKARQQKMALAASRLDHVRLAWRNDVMHPKAKYDEKEANEVLMNVKGFLESCYPVRAGRAPLI